MKKEKIKRRNERFTEDQIEAQRSGFDLERRSSGMSALCFLQKKRSKRYKACSDVVEVAGLEPTASASRTQRSTKLSHTSLCNWGKKKMVEVAGLEPTASASRTQRSTKLSHTSLCNWGKRRWSRWRDLNPRPLRPERSALPN